MSQEAINLIIKYFILFGFFVVVPLVIFMSKKPKQKKMAWKNSSSVNGHQEPYGKTDTASASSLEKQTNEYINCFFNYNGKQYDAYEVLGIPAGSDRHKIEKAYKAKKSLNKQIIEAAYKTLKI